MDCWGQCVGAGCGLHLEHKREGGAKDAPRFLDCGEPGRGGLEAEDDFKLKHL